MAWIAPIPPSPRHPKPRWQVRYQEGRRQRSAGIYNNPKAAEAVRKRIDRGVPIEADPTDAVDATKLQTLFGDYLTKVWWPTWKAQHPGSSYQTGKRTEKRILPVFGNLRFAALDADRIGAWKAQLVAAGLKPATVNSYLSLLGTVLNAAVDSGYLSHSPLMRRSGAGRVAVAKNVPVGRRKVWVTRGQLDNLVEAIAPRYQALARVAALTGMHWGELAAVRWDDLRLDQPLDDGAVEGSGRLRIVRALSDPSRNGNGHFKGPKTEAGRRTIALDQESCDTFRGHWERFGDKDAGAGVHHPWRRTRQRRRACRQQLPAGMAAGARAGRSGGWLGIASFPVGIQDGCSRQSLERRGPNVSSSSTRTHASPMWLNEADHTGGSYAADPTGASR
jgi:integrase